MKYRLIVLTHGDSEPLTATLASFVEHVSPLPADAFMHIDGPTPTSVAYHVARNLSAWEWILSEDQQPVGFCGSCAECWEEAGHGDHDYAFWLEHDFTFVRPVDLRELALTLDANPQLAQMALMRQPVNEQEVEAGGVVASRPGQFSERVGDYGRWLEQRSYWTTNPSLFNANMARGAHRWPEGDRCEGRFGIYLREQGFTFGMWGNGEPWVEHVGARSGFGY